MGGGRRCGSWGIGLLLAGALGLGGFYAHYWGALGRLPALARRRAEIGGGHYVPLSAVSPWFVKALVATEDQSFYHNWGISFEGIGRALLVDLREGRFAQGGSTLTQQLVRDLLLSPVKTIPRKVTGSLLALAVTARYSKTAILTMYVNEVYLGDGAYGIDAASRRYFGLPPRRLNLAESALLAGLPVAPSALDPLRHLQAAKARQLVVLQAMVGDGMLSAAQARQAAAAPLPLLRSPPRS